MLRSMMTDDAAHERTSAWCHPVDLEQSLDMRGRPRRAGHASPACVWAGGDLRHDRVSLGFPWLIARWPREQSARSCAVRCRASGFAKRPFVEHARSMSRAGCATATTASWRCTRRALNRPSTNSSPSCESARRWHGLPLSKRFRPGSGARAVRDSRRQRGGLRRSGARRDHAALRPAPGGRWRHALVGDTKRTVA